MKPSWQQRCVNNYEQFIQRAQAKGNLTTDTEVLRFLTLAICGEAGELANLVKKSWRGDPVDQAQIRDEMADIRIYLEHLARNMKFDLDQACERKVDEVAGRLATED